MLNNKTNYENLIRMIQQNKTERPLIDNEPLNQFQAQEDKLEQQIKQQQVKKLEEDQSKIDIVVSSGKKQDEHWQKLAPLKLIDSDTESQLAKTPHIEFKQSRNKVNDHDVSAVCIDLFSDNQTFERKCTLNSLHNEKIFASIIKQQNILIFQDIKTCGQKNTPKLIEQDQRSKQKVQTEEHYQNVQKGETQQREQKELKFIEVLVQTEDRDFTRQQKQDSCNQSQVDNNIKQSLISHSNEPNVLQYSLPQIRNRQVTFQQEKRETSEEKEQIKVVEQQIKQDEVLSYVNGINEADYQQIIVELQLKAAKLEKQYQKMLVRPEQKVQKIQQFFEKPKQKADQIQQNSRQFQVQIQSLATHKITRQVQYHFCPKRLQIQKTLQISIVNNNLKSHSQIPSPHHQPPSHQCSVKQQQVSSKNFNNPQYFSSGDIQNLLESHDQLIDLKDLQANAQIDSAVGNLSQIPVLFQPTLHAQKPARSMSFSLPVLQLSKSNLATIKESYDQLPYERFRNIMRLDQIVTKISFKQKHYPCSTSTQKQIKLYGKRLLRLLCEQVPQIGSRIEQKNNMIALQNDMEFHKNQQHLVYYLKNNQNFVIVCYLNHTIYIGEYITTGPMQQITRQGYGLQIRDQKYIYQGQFFADKKHGYGYVEFVGKNPFIYSGYFLDGFMDGHGKSMNQNGQIYIGDYKLGQRDGIGKLIYNAQKNVFYEGQFYDGFKHGKGQEAFENGDSYQGSYSRDKFEGQGQYKWNNGTIYQGTFVDGFKHGKGTLIFTNGKSFEKYYDHNRQINLEDDKKTIKSSRISIISHSKTQEKTFIQEKARNFRNGRSFSGQNFLSNKSRSRSLKLIADKKKLAQLLKQKQIQDDLKNLDRILKDPGQENTVKKIFSVKKLDTRDVIVGKMYNIAERPTFKMSESAELDLFKLSKFGSQKKTIIKLDQQERLEELRESTHPRGVQRITNFSQF